MIDSRAPTRSAARPPPGRIITAAAITRMIATLRAFFTVIEV